MIVDVDGVEAHAATGAAPPNAEDPVLVLVHGAGMDGTVWQHQTRYLGHRKVRAIAVDLPGHGGSRGEAFSAIADNAEWLMRFIEAAEIGRVHLAGHSMGAFVALHAAAESPVNVASLTLFGVADAMPVHPDLVAAAAADLPAAAALMAAWGHSLPSHIGLSPTPGMWMIGSSRALVETSRPGVLSADFDACISFDLAADLASKVSCPVTIVIADADKMTPPRAARSLADSFAAPSVFELKAGHMMLHERPREVRTILLDAVSQSHQT
jgi:pimeloyl-ACP methyl ester carboxylesterase